MQISIAGRHTSVTEAMKRYATEKFARLERHNDLLQSVDVVMNIENERQICEMIARTKVGKKLIGKSEHTDMYAAIDLLFDKMDRRLSKQKEKVKVERKHSGRLKLSEAEHAPSASEPSLDGAPPSGP